VMFEADVITNVVDQKVFKGMVSSVRSYLHTVEIQTQNPTSI